jgi:hypothetical protein
VSQAHRLKNFLKTPWSAARLKGRTPREDLHLFFEAILESIFFNFKIVTGLQIEPEALRKSKIPRKPQRCIRGDGPIAMRNLIDATRGDADVACQAILRKRRLLATQSTPDVERLDYAEMIAPRAVIWKFRLIDWEVSDSAARFACQPIQPPRRQPAASLG